MLRDINPDVILRWFDKQVRFSSAELPMGFMDKLGPLQSAVEPVLQNILGLVVDMKVDFDVEMFWNRVDGKRVIQAHAPPQRPVVMHPDTGLPTWFCNVHSHSMYLRDERDGVVSSLIFPDVSLIPAPSTSVPLWILLLQPYERVFFRHLQREADFFHTGTH